MSGLDDFNFFSAACNSEVVRWALFLSVGFLRRQFWMKRIAHAVMRLNTTKLENWSIGMIGRRIWASMCRDTSFSSISYWFGGRDSFSGQWEGDSLSQVPPEGMVNKLRGVETSGSTISGIVSWADMSPFVWRDEINYVGDSITNVCLESFMASIQPI